MSKQYKVFIGVGHGGSDPGAVGYVTEKDVNLTMALACKEVLEANGVLVKMSRTRDENDALTEEINECNAFNPDLAIDVHNNAGGGDGFEAIYSTIGTVGKVMAKNIEEEVEKLGQNSRGLKTRRNSKGNDYYGFIRCTRCPAVIVEGVFVDNATDVKIINTLEKQKEFGRAYARGILKTLGINPINEVTSSVPFAVRVDISNLYIRKGPGTNYGVNGVIKKGVYTVVDIKAGKGSAIGWGKLKSGVGWISLDYTKSV